MVTPLRTRTGCLTCRRRKKKCDEKIPTCSGCARNQLKCVWPPLITFQSGTTRVQRGHHQALPPSRRPTLHEFSSSLDDPASNATSPVRDSGEEIEHTTGEDDDYATEDFNAPITSFVKSVFTAPGGRVLGQLQLPEDDDTAESATIGSPAAGPQAWETPAIARARLFSAQQIPLSPLNLRPSHNDPDPALLNYYLTRTVESLGNGASIMDPFVVQVLPLAMTDSLLLQLLLAQTAAHRAEIAWSTTGPGAILHRSEAQDYYSLAIRSFRTAVSDYMTGNKDKVIVLAIGILTLCVTEMTKGDVSGAFLYHLLAARSIFTDLVSSMSVTMPKSLKDFLVEYYIYTATLSMISVDDADQDRLALDPALQRAGSELVDQDYVGSLCGSWLPLLMIIPEIVKLKNRLCVHTERFVMSSPDSVMIFSSLQTRIASYEPTHKVEQEIAFAGRVFQQTMMLSLLTVLGLPDDGDAGAHRIAIDHTIDEALLYLEQIPITARINTNFIWPLAVLGSCLTEAHKQACVRTRLSAMCNYLGFGSVRATLKLLEHIWQGTTADLGPWALRKTMRDLHVSVSFA